MRSSLASSVAIFAAICCGAISSGAAEKLKISVYYETLCPDSIRFIKNQLAPVYNLMPDYLTLDFVPYGIAETESLPNGTFTFVCQHGVEECYGNKVHACAIKQLDSSKAAALINCTMSNSNPPRAGEQCSKELGIDYEPIRACAESEPGTLLLVENGVRTKSLNPALNWVPWITYNDRFFEEDLDPSQTNLLPVVCKHLSGEKPPACGQFNGKLKFSVYYESLCPDCISFIKNQVYPVYTEKDIASYITLDLVPYGFATTRTLSNGTITFKCQHGEEECYGNKLHACAISKLSISNAAAFINCTMSSRRPPRAGKKCASLLKIDFAPIKTCSNSAEGAKLLAQNGVRSNSLKPEMYEVAWITFNDVFYKEDLEPAQQDLLPILCKHLEGNGLIKPTCNPTMMSSNNSNGASNNFLICFSCIIAIILMSGLLRL